MQRKLTLPVLATQSGLLAALFLVYHVLLRALMLRGGLRLGAVSYKLAPLYAYWRPHLKGWLVPALAVATAYAIWLRRTRIATSLTAPAAAVSFWLWFLAITTAVAMISGGPRALVGPLARSDLEYYGAVDRVDGVARFLRDYPRVAARLPMHAQVHPPGAVLFLWAARGAGGGVWGAAASIILVSSLAVPLVYVWAHGVGGPGVARRAAALYVVVPSIVLFTATSMDGPFAACLIAAMALFWRALDDRPVRRGVAAGLAAGLAAMMTYSVAIVLVFAGIAAVVRLCTARGQRARVVAAAAAALAAFLAFHAALWIATGYDPVAALRAAVANSDRIMAGARHESIARYAHLAVGNLAVFFIAAGLPITLLWWPAVTRSWRALAGAHTGRADDGTVATGSVWLDTPLVPPLLRGGRWRWLVQLTPYRTVPPDGDRDPQADRRPLPLADGGNVNAARDLACVGSLTLLVAALAPIYTLEVERIWMFLVPLAVIPVAGALFDQERGHAQLRGTLAVAVLLAAQTLLTEALLGTYW